MSQKLHNETDLIKWQTIQNSAVYFCYINIFYKWIGNVHKGNLKMREILPGKTRTVNLSRVYRRLQFGKTDIF